MESLPGCTLHEEGDMQFSDLDTSDSHSALSDLGETSRYSNKRGTFLSPRGNAAQGEAVESECGNPRSSGERKSTHVGGGLSQNTLFLLTLAMMLLAARFMLPMIVEEVRYAWHRGELRAQYENGSEGLQQASLDLVSRTSELVTQKVGPSVVHIEVRRSASSEQIDLANFLQQRRGIHSQGSTMGESSDQGSGVIVDADGYILTNEHVIAGGSAIEIGLSDGRRLPARVIGVDALTDLALLKIEASGLIPIEFGHSNQIRVGSAVWALGSPFGLDRTVTSGILSGKHRMVKSSTRYQDFMQSDAAINPGNSGGPLVDSRGRLIGINTAIVGDSFRGVSFAIPSSIAKTVYERIKETGQVQRGWLGVALAEVPMDAEVPMNIVAGTDLQARGALVAGIAGSDSPAAQSGITPGDIVLQIDDVIVQDMGHLMREVANLTVGQTASLRVLRDQQHLTMDVIIGIRPPEAWAR